ncbi:MAG: efflux RND transporter periplasmic adaptor subunit, partial [Planctomycetota bacterium]
MRSVITRFAPLLFLTLTFGTAIRAQTPVRVANVDVRPIQHRHAVTGSLRAVARGDLAALESGRLIQLTAREGQAVRKGDRLAEVDSRRLEAQKGEAEADLEVAKAELIRFQAVAQRADADLARAKRLVREDAVSRQEWDAAQADAKVAEADIVSAERRIERLKQSIRLLDVRLSDTVVHAPYDATVVTRHVEPGDWVQPGEPLLTLVSTGEIEAWLEVPERYVEALENFGDQVVVRSRATGRDTVVLSTRRVAEVNQRVRTIRFVVNLANADGLLTSGMSVDGWIAVTGQQPQTVVPKDAVIRSGQDTYVYRVDAQSNAQRVPVKVLFETTRAIAIAANDLQVGDQVIVEGNERL